MTAANPSTSKGRRSKTRITKARSPKTGIPKTGIPKASSPATRVIHGSWRLASLLGVAAFALYMVYSALQWNSFAVRSWDLGIFTQLAKAYSELQFPPIVDIKGAGYNLWGDHFHPILLALGPVYKLFPSAFTLLVVQNLLLAISVVVVSSLAMKRLGNVPGLLLGFAYALSWGLQSAIDAQFHEVAFAVPFMALALYALMEEKWRSAWIWAALLVFVKEDLGLTVLVIGLLMAWRGPRAAGLWLAVWGVLWFVLATKVVLPAMNTSEQWAYSSQLDFAGLFADPALLFQKDKIATTLLLVVITATCCLYSPLSAIVLPTLAWRFLSELEVYWGQTWQYSAVLMPVVFCAAIDALSRRKVLDSARLRLLLCAFMALLAIGLSSQYSFGKLNNIDQYFSTAANASAQKAIAAVPAGVSVETDISVMSYLVDGNHVFWVGNPKNPAPDYVLMDVSGRENVGESSTAKEAQSRFPGTIYTTVYADGHYQVAKKSG